jgi:steroid delta-isomerase-like uncharacterized protein
VPTPKEIVKTWSDAFNAHDTMKIGECYSEDAINFQVADEPIRGKEAIKSGFAYLFAAFPDIGFRIENLFEDGDWAILEWFGWGTLKGEFLGFSPTGKRYELRGCGFFHVENEKIVFQRGYWDKLTWFSQVGITPR